MKNIEKIIKNTNEQNQNKVDWSKAWSKKYPVLETYQNKINVKDYEKKLNELITSLMNDYGYSYQDAMLILKDILYKEYIKNK